MPRVPNGEANLLASIAATLEGEYATDELDPWVGSPFEWIKGRPSRQVGAIGEKLVAGWCAAKDFDVVRSPDSDADRIIHGYRFEVKFSTLWKRGEYKFQQIRNQQYDYLFCLGVAPFDANAWLVPKHVLFDHVIGHTGQHTGAAGAETSWLGFDASTPPAWLEPHGGQLEDVARILDHLPRGPL